MKTTIIDRLVDLYKFAINSGACFEHEYWDFSMNQKTLDRYKKELGFHLKGYIKSFHIKNCNDPEYKWFALGFPIRVSNEMKNGAITFGGGTPPQEKNNYYK